MYGTDTISRCVKHLKTEFKNIMYKETYTRKEYMELFDSINGKLTTAQREKEQLEFKMVEDKKVSDTEFNDEIKRLKALVKHEKDKREILEQKIFGMTDEFVDTLTKLYGEYKHQ